MAIWNLGSINVDHFYSVPHLPQPGETLAATAHSVGLGGKGINQSVAAARAGADVRHIGAIGPDGSWAIDRLAGYGVDITSIGTVPEVTGHAIITVASDGENAIVLHPGANHSIDPANVQSALSGSTEGDLLLMQNETSLQAETAKLGSDRGLRLVYSAAPFDVAAVKAVISHVYLLIVNEIEARQLAETTGTEIEHLGVPNVLITRGADGASWYGAATENQWLYVPAVAVEPVDTTGAGDTFAGYVAAGLDAGMTPQAAMSQAARAAALKVTRKGTADAIPALEEVLAFQPS